MASHIGDGDYLGAYRRFFVDFLEKVNPDDQLPIKTSGHDVPEGEIVGEIIYMTLQYLDQHYIFGPRGVAAEKKLVEEYGNVVVPCFKPGKLTTLN